MGGTLVIGDGDLTGLLACAAGADGRVRTGPNAARPTKSEAPLAWFPPLGDAQREQRRRAHERHADLYGLTLIAAAPTPPDADTTAMSGGEIATRTLIEGAYLAARHGADTVIWPMNAGPELKGTIDLDRVTRAVDRALLASRLVALDAAELRVPPVRISVPYADYSDAQIADLAVDMDLPVWTCWWWDGTDTASVAAGERWHGALAAAGWRGRRPGWSARGEGGGRARVEGEPSAPPEVIVSTRSEPMPTKSGTGRGPIAPGNRRE